MQSGDYIRRIDDLGRIVIPKDIRRAEHIQEGDAFQISSSENGIIMTKYSSINTLEIFAKKYADAIFESSLIPTMVCNLDRVIAASGISDRLIYKCRISSSAESYIRNRKAYLKEINSNDCINPLEDLDYAASIIYPISNMNEVAGAIIMLKSEDVNIPTESAIKLAQTAASFLGKLLEG